MENRPEQLNNWKSPGSKIHAKSQEQEKKVLIKSSWDLESVTDPTLKLSRERSVSLRSCALCGWGTRMASFYSPQHSCHSTNNKPRNNPCLKLQKGRILQRLLLLFVWLKRYGFSFSGSNIAIYTWRYLWLEKERCKLEQFKEMEGSLKQTPALSQFGLEPGLRTMSAWLLWGSLYASSYATLYFCFI